MLYKGEVAIPIEIFAAHIASALLALMEWWLENEMPHPPERMAEIYSQLVVQAAWKVMPDIDIRIQSDEPGI